MPRLLLVVGCLVLLLVVGSASAERRQARLEPISDTVTRGEIRPVQSLSTAEPCIVRHDLGIAYKIDGWVTGNELYKSYLDPALSCPSPYPFTVTEINMPMYFGGTPTFTASVDIELVDSSDPTCPAPGQLIAISGEYQLTVDAPGLYDIWIPLDTPVVVNGPFFAGFFIGTAFDVVDSAAVLIDANPTVCRAYNAWDTAIGFVDLGNNEIWNFPGRLVLYAQGIAAGGPPEPSVELLAPAESDTLLGAATLWIRDRNASTALDYAVFEYRPAAGGPYAEIGRDFDATSPLRDGATAVPGGDGLSYSANFAAVPEGQYFIRATVYDTLGRDDADSALVYVEPTPPIPTIISHENGDSFCRPLTVNMVCSDENLDFVQVFRKSAVTEYSSGVGAVGPSSRGSDHAAALAAAAAIQLWYDRGYTAPMIEYAATIPLDTLASRLADRFKIELFNGSLDDNVFVGLRDYLAFKGGQLKPDFYRNPDYFKIRDWAENQERTVLLGVSGDPGTWLAVDGFFGFEQMGGIYRILAANPLSGVIEDMPVRIGVPSTEIYFDGSWHPIDIMISISAPDWTVSRVSVGVDFDPADGITVSWSPSGLIEGDRFFIDMTGRDELAFKGTSTALLRYACNGTYDLGDFNGDTFTDIADADYLLRFIALGGATPLGGAGRADANCDGYVNVADVVYFLNYLLGGASAPCY